MAACSQPSATSSAPASPATAGWRPGATTAVRFLQGRSRPAQPALFARPVLSPAPHGTPPHTHARARARASRAHVDPPGAPTRAGGARVQRWPAADRRRALLLQPRLCLCAGQHNGAQVTGRRQHVAKRPAGAQPPIRRVLYLGARGGRGCWPRGDCVRGERQRPARDFICSNPPVLRTIVWCVCILQLFFTGARKKLGVQ
jgi:hypothetical protein